LTLDPADRVLFAVSEIGNYDTLHGLAVSFAIDPGSGTLTELSRADSGGGGPTHLSYDHRARSLFVANFGSGAVAALPVARGGSLLAPVSVQRETGSGPHPKQKSAHAHAAILDPSGRWLLVPDMGADKLFVYRFDPATRRLSPAPVPSLFTGPGTGPRHMVFSRDGRFVFLVTEHAAEVRVLRWNARSGTLAPVQAMPLDPAGFADQSAAEIALSRDGRFLYTSNRGRDRLQVFAVARAGGKLSPVQDIASGGDRPRSFGIDPGGRWMLVGNQDSQTIAVFEIDRRTGRLSPHGAPITVSEKPVAFAFFPMGPATVSTLP
jgi:6-phosphogluconolactonase